MNARYALLGALLLGGCSDPSDPPGSPDGALPDSAAPDADADGDQVVAVFDGEQVEMVAGDASGVYWTVRNTFDDPRLQLYALDVDATEPRMLVDHAGQVEGTMFALVGDRVVYELTTAIFKTVLSRLKTGPGALMLHGGNSEGLRHVASSASAISLADDSDLSDMLIGRVDPATAALTTIAEYPATTDNAERIVTALDATHVYWTDGTVIWRGNGDGVSNEMFATTPTPATALALDDSYVYWMESDGLYKLAKDAAGQARITVSVGDGVGAADRILFDDGHVYWLDAQLSASARTTILRAPLDVAEAPTLVVSRNGVHDFAITEAGLYYTLLGVDQGRLMLRPRSNL